MLMAHSHQHFFLQFPALIISFPELKTAAGIISVTLYC